MQDKIGIHCFITGQVQGVWFRASTQEQAEKLQIRGWVRNLPDGRVEVLACGKKEKIELLYNWLKVGPSGAKVVDVTREEISWEKHPHFAVR